MTNTPANGDEVVMTDMIEKCAAAVRTIHEEAHGDEESGPISICARCAHESLSLDPIQHAPDCCHDIVRAVLDAAGVELDDKPQGGPCKLRWCISDKAPGSDKGPASATVIENIGDGSWNVAICSECLEALSMKEGGELPNSVEVQRVLVNARRRKRRARAALQEHGGE